MFQSFLPTIIRELRSLTKVITLVINIYDGYVMMAACLLMYAMFLDMVLPVLPLPFVSCKCFNNSVHVLVIQINVNCTICTVKDYQYMYIYIYIYRTEKVNYIL